MPLLMSNKEVIVLFFSDVTLNYLHNKNKLELQAVKKGVEALLNKSGHIPPHAVLCW